MPTRNSTSPPTCQSCRPLRTMPPTGEEGTSDTGKSIAAISRFSFAILHHEVNLRFRACASASATRGTLGQWYRAQTQCVRRLLEGRGTHLAPHKPRRFLTWLVVLKPSEESVVRWVEGDIQCFTCCSQCMPPLRSASDCKRSRLALCSTRLQPSSDACSSLTVYWDTRGAADHVWRPVTPITVAMRSVTACVGVDADQWLRFADP